MKKVLLIISVLMILFSSSNVYAACTESKETYNNWNCPRISKSCLAETDGDKYWCYLDNDKNEYSGVAKTIGLGIIALGLCRIAAIIGLIGFTIYDGVMVVINPDNKKNFSKKALTRGVIVVALFVLPALVNMAINMFTGENTGADEVDYKGSACWQCANQYKEKTFTFGG